MTLQKLSFICDERKVAARTAVRQLKKRYGHTAPHKAEVIVVLGGDGFMLHTLHAYMNTNIPVYGMNFGAVGFLMNDYNAENLAKRIAVAEKSYLHPLYMEAHTVDKKCHEAIAINEVSLFRQSSQSAKISISVDKKIRMQELICDGVVAATPAGSTAYNLSLQGPIIPLDAPLIALTPISPFRPRRWRGALLSQKVTITFKVREPKKRPVSVAADYKEYKNIERVTVKARKKAPLELLFDKGHSLSQRVLNEQFLT